MSSRQAVAVLQRHGESQDQSLCCSVMAGRCSHHPGHQEVQNHRHSDGHHMNNNNKYGDYNKFNYADYRR